MKLKLANSSILNCLELAAKKKEFIYTKHHQKGLGKTTALIQFAKENNYVVLVPNQTVARTLRKYFDYQGISNIDSSTLEGFGMVVFDEGCTSKQIEKMKSAGNIVVTGFLVQNG
ncbi:hypothetical protein [Metabacillus fastidiosus]|uniref:hypothetical protein n=1 Tax=Metabacillus fastidiosus TaxID=1458 RepID=UPI003D29D474